ncbi:hypothetical protein [Flavobacterium sp. IB48]|uniref:hypothetical protein n=1 Tax=Flavobacterium sp. IB48 TaxID=2779375 RepID=UPI0018E8741B|nr:hypothetical protein [Flavobacterium sp. IB48]MBJ2125573.1 hypothetical protein [Flavobacterium sp. IB48]
MKDFFKNLFRKSGDEIDNYEYKGAEDIIITCSSLRACNRHSDAIRLYEKFEQKIATSDYDMPGLTTIIKICEENSAIDKMINYAKALKKIAPDHPWVIELSKRYTL